MLYNFGGMAGWTVACTDSSQNSMTAVPREMRRSPSYRSFKIIPFCFCLFVFVFLFLLALPRHGHVNGVRVEAS